MSSNKDFTHFFKQSKDIPNLSESGSKSKTGTSATEEGTSALDEGREENNAFIEMI